MLALKRYRVLNRILKAHRSCAEAALKPMHREDSK